MPVYQAERAQRAAETASQGITEMPVTPGSQCLTSSQRRARAKRVEKTCPQLYAMTRSQRDKDRKQDPPLRMHIDGTATGDDGGHTDKGTHEHTDEGTDEARDLPGGQTYLRDSSKTVSGLRVRRRSLGIHTRIQQGTSYGQGDTAIRKVSLTIMQHLSSSLLGTCIPLSCIFRGTCTDIAFHCRR